MSDFIPYVEKQTVQGREVLLCVENFRSEDWYGFKGWMRKLNDEKKAQWQINYIHTKLLNFIRPGDVIFDCGANEGYITTLFSIWTGPTGKVLAFEPDPKNVAVIKKNINANNLKNVEIIEAAVSSVSGKELMFGSEVIGGSSAEMFKVKTVCLDEYAKLKPSLVKIDVEGYELPVLRGSTEILSQGAIFEVEMHLSPTSGIHMKRRFGFEPDDIIKIFQKHGYSINYNEHPIKLGDEFEGVWYAIKEGKNVR